MIGVTGENKKGTHIYTYIHTYTVRRDCHKQVTYRARDVEPCELVDLGSVELQRLEQPIIRLSPGLELEGADGVVDVLQAGSEW